MENKNTKRLSGPKSLKNDPVVFKKDNRSSLKTNFMSNDYNKRFMLKTNNTSSHRSKYNNTKNDEENLSSS